MRKRRAVQWLPLGAALLGSLLVGWWLIRQPGDRLTVRVPGTDRGPSTAVAGTSNPVLAGKLLPGPGRTNDLPGEWREFRGPGRAGASSATTRLARSWDSPGPRELWSVEVGEGYAGAAVATGRVYLMDYDRDQKQDAIRCLSLADGQEIWRYAYPVAVKRNHGMSRTVPALAEKQVVAMGPKCHVTCLDLVSGELRWALDLVQQYGTTVPPWYAGQCPLIDSGAVILAPGGEKALLVAVDLETGQERWRTPNPKGWKMTHTSIMPMEINGERTYVYCASLGVVGVSAKDGRLLWQTPDWKISIANVPSPVIVDGGRIFLSGGYDAGSRMLQIQAEKSEWLVKTLFKLEPEIFGATQHSPILFNEHLYGVRPDGQFVCLDLNGKVLWTSGSGGGFGLGPFLLADGLFFAMNDSGTLSLIEATPEKFNRLAQGQVLKGRESWGPLAIAGSRLIARDLTRMVCLEVGSRATAP